MKTDILKSCLAIAKSSKLLNPLFLTLMSIILRINKVQICGDSLQNTTEREALIFTW
jgi:hypothetical protein